METDVEGCWCRQCAAVMILEINLQLFVGAGGRIARIGKGDG